MFSFCGNKIITTGEGGIIVTDSHDTYEKLKLIRSHGRLETENYFTSSKLMDYIVLGYNWRMSNITASLGVSQMEKLDMVIRMRRKNAEYMTKKLSKIREITTPTVPPRYHHIYQMYTIKAEKRDALKKYLTEKRIMTQIYFQPVHLTEFYRKTFKYKVGELPTTEKITRQVLTLPMYPTLTEDDVNYVVESIKEFYNST
jgi:perosamine synthetase